MLIPGAQHAQVDHCQLENLASVCQWVTRDCTTGDSFKREVCLGVALLCLKMDAETLQVKA